MPRMLIVRTDGIGDFIIFSAVLEKYLELYPDYEIDILCDHKVKDLIVSIPFVSAVFCINPFNVRRKKYIPYFLWTLLRLNLRNYAVIIYPQYSRRPEDEFILQHIKAQEKIAFDGNSSNDEKNTRFARNKYFTRVITSDAVEKPEIERNIELIQKLGGKIDVNDLKTKVWFSKADEAAADRILSTHGFVKGKYFCVFPGPEKDIRSWGIDSWASTIQQLRLIYPELKVAVLGFGTDNIFIEAILAKIGPQERSDVVNFCSKTSLRELANIISHAKVCVGRDTGTIHITAAVGTPNVCIMGGGHFGRFYPYGNLQRNRIVSYKMDCFGCNWRCIYAETKCIKNITVENVLKEVDVLMKAGA